MNNVDFSRYSTEYLYELVEAIQAEIKAREGASDVSRTCFACEVPVNSTDAFDLDNGVFACSACFQESESVRQVFNRAFFYDVIDDGGAEYSKV